MENLSCHSNQTKESAFIKAHKLPITQPDDDTDEIWPNWPSGFRGDVV